MMKLLSTDVLYVHFKLVYRQYVFLKVYVLVFVNLDFCQL